METGWSRPSPSVSTHLAALRRRIGPATVTAAISHPVLLRCGGCRTPRPSLLLHHHHPHPPHALPLSPPDAPTGVSPLVPCPRSGARDSEPPAPHRERQPHVCRAARRLPNGDAPVWGQLSTLRYTLPWYLPESPAVKVRAQLLQCAPLRLGVLRCFQRGSGSPPRRPAAERLLRRRL